MTPEFRNAIYKWRYKGSQEEAEKSIPYQLQKLFVQLQFSGKRAVETTDVTKSFGWDSSDAWQQHDVQELCRVMFDALETVFKNTDQAQLINHLYQGQLKDYVKCLECEYESARIDKFLDIPLVIRPFGANVPHESVEEALDSFVNPETLNGNNQYKCDKCDKLCDAHKGLKFCKFPYIMMLQLKRFAFDYNLLHRIKLNDRMSFPQLLNLNKYIYPNDELLNLMDNDDNLSPKSDSPSSIETETDSGVSLTSSENDTSSEDALNDVSMDVNEGSAAGCADSDNFEENDCTQDMKGPEGSFVYKLFSIMIHSGSAIGGHYYAYIRSFEDDQWYSFNDQTVSKITESDIERTFGGSYTSNKSYYSSTYSSSANAYMLIYRQIRPDNRIFLQENELPQHVKKLVASLGKEELREKELKEFKHNMCKIKLFCFHEQCKMSSANFEIHKGKTLREATEKARDLFDLEDVVSLENCRIVKYDEYNEHIELSYDGQEEWDMDAVLGGAHSIYRFDLLLEIKRDGEEFPVYESGAVTIKAHLANVSENRVLPAFNVRVSWTDSLKTLQDSIRKKLQTSCEYIVMVWERHSSEFYELKPSSEKTLKDESFFKKNKIFVQCTDDEPGETLDEKLLQVLDYFSNSITLEVHLPQDVYTTQQRVSEISIHKETTLGEFKRSLEQEMGCSSEMFKVFRVYSTNQETEMDRLNDTFSIVPDKSKIRIKHGRALKTGEFRAKIFLFRLNEEQHTEFLIEIILSKRMKIYETKVALIEELTKSSKKTIPLERMRLRKKSWKSPGRVYQNHQVLDDVILTFSSCEFFVEELEGREPVESTNSIVYFVRRWRPSTYVLDALWELVLDSSATIDDLKAQMAHHDEINTENIEVAKGRGSFPFSISTLDIHEDLEWNPEGDKLKHYPLMVTDDGAMFYYRDKTEELMELTEDKKKEIKKAEDAKSLSSATKSSYKPKEKALKIYTDR
ncbi:ubiquitin carboxyl-terminal hydrolase 47-like isoform X2 [Xenia sp. Carnegie-2017]|nr:ubiquitin carboxyl-terminal hydrolase 47-like isoform X2 [Xenia sp. Carnegie-2017]